MRLKSQPQLSTKYKQKKRRKLPRIVAFFIFCVLLFFLGAILHEEGVLGIGLKNYVKGNVKIPVNYYNSFFVAEEDMSLNISHEDYQMLAYCREKALEDGYMSDSNKVYVPALLVYKGEESVVKLRLKGYWPDHWEDDKKWSFRVKVKGNNNVMGLKSFALQHPQTRNYLYEWFAQKLYDDNGILSVRYHFVRLKVNGDDYGIYAIEENFEKQIIESNNRREGPVMRFSGEYYGTKDHYVEHYGSAVELDPKYQRATHLLESFRIGKLPAHQVFDVKLMARYFALADLLYATHATASHNVRFYYNPITSLLEPVAYDAEILMHEYLKRPGMIGEHLFHREQEDIEKINFISSEFYHILLFNDPVFFKAYVSELEKIAGSNILEEFFDKYRKEIDRKLNIIHQTYPVYLFEETFFYDRLTLIRDRLNMRDDLHAYVDSENEEWILEVQSNSSWPIEIVSWTYDEELHMLDEPYLIDSKLPNNTEKDLHQISIGKYDDINNLKKGTKHIKVKYRILGAKKIKEFDSQNYRYENVSQSASTHK